jgi:hypothetical protein
MNAYNLVLGLPLCKARKPEIDWTKGRLTALRMRNGWQQVKIPEADRARPLPERSEENTNDEPSLPIQLLEATAFGHRFSSEEVVQPFAIPFGECQGLLAVSLDGITEGEGNRRMLNAQAGAAAVVAAEE